MNKLIVAALMLILAVEVFGGGTVVPTSFYSQCLGEMRHVRVYLPEGYESQGWQRYPVIYYLHGAGPLLGHDDFKEVVVALNILIDAGDIKPVIAVCPDGFTSPYPASFYTSSALYGNVQGCMTCDLVSWMDENYRTIPSRMKRAIMGHSMGGYGALKYYAECNGTFCCVASVCGSGLDLPCMMEDNIDMILGELLGPPYVYNPAAGFYNGVLFSMAGAFSPNLENPPYYVDIPLDEKGKCIPEIWELWMEHNLPHYMRQLPAAIGSSPAIYMDAGTLDEFKILPSCKAFTDSLTAMGIPFDFQVFEGGHFDKLHERFPIAIDFLCSFMHHNWGYDEMSGMETVAGNVNEVFGWHSAVGGEYSSDGQIRFQLLSSGNVVLDIYDMSGRKVATLMDGYLNAGVHSASVSNAELADGIYLYSLRSGDCFVSGKLLNIR